MNHTIQKFKNFIFQDVKSKDETKDFAVLLRITAIILGVYYILTGIIVAYNKHYFVGLTLVLALAILTGAFICTYENHTTLALVLINVVLIIFTSVLAFFVGYGLDYQFLIFLNILLIYYNQTDYMALKKLYTIGLCVYVMILAIYSDSFGSAGVEVGFPTVLTRCVNLIAIVSSLSSIAYCYCTKFNQAENKLKAKNKELEAMANYDTLTGLSNRRHMNEHLSKLVYEHNRSGKNFTLAIGDIDFFKKVNDTYGHDTGDYVLSTVSKIFTEYMKDKGRVSRWGGEEFLFAFENMNLQQAYTKLDDLRKIIESTPMEFKEYHFRVTMTYGLEEFNERLGVEVTIKHADDKLYIGKTSGRNRVIAQ